MEYPKNVRFIKRTIAKIGPITIYSLCTTPFGSLTGEVSKTFNIGGGGCMLVLELMSKPADFRNRTFLLFETVKDEFLSDMKEVCQWFLDEKYKDLFFIAEDGNLMINLAYKDLIKVIRENKRDYKTMCVAPTLIVDSLGARKEGVAFRINTVDSEVSMTYRDFVRFYNVLVDINYGIEYQTLLTIYNQCVFTGRINGDPRQNTNQFFNDGSLIRRKPVDDK